MERARRLALAAVAAALVAVCQWATVHANYGGNWTALFCTGALMPHPPLVANEHVYLFAGSNGYDGQFYHFEAHDPAMRGDLKKYIDDPRMRYRRILVPFAAWMLALGNQNVIDYGYYAVCLLAVGLGAYWSCGLAVDAGRNAAWGMLFLLVPAVPITADRLVVEAALAALTVGYVRYRERRWPFLCAAGLVRETGLLLIAGECCGLIVKRQFRRAVLAAGAAVPTLAWYAYVQAHTPPGSYEMSFVPLRAVVAAVLHPTMHYLRFEAIVRAADVLALAGMLLAMVMATGWWREKRDDPVRIAALLFAGMAVVLQRYDLWQDVYGYGRVFSPLLICVATGAVQTGRVGLLMPIVMIAPRLAIQLGPQVLGIVGRHS